LDWQIDVKWEILTITKL